MPPHLMTQKHAKHVWYNGLILSFRWFFSEIISGYRTETSFLSETECVTNHRAQKSYTTSVREKSDFVSIILSCEHLWASASNQINASHKNDRTPQKSKIKNFKRFNKKPWSKKNLQTPLGPRPQSDSLAMRWMTVLTKSQLSQLHPP